MPAVKRRYFILIFVLVLILVGLSARLHLADLLITAPMQQAGLEDVTADISHLALNQTQLSHLSFTLLTNTGRLSLNAHDITINYLPGRLIKGRIDTLEIEDLTLHYELNKQSTEAPGEVQQDTPALQPIMLLALLREALYKYTVFNKLSIYHISVNGEPFAELDGKTLRLISTHDEGAIYSEITLLGETSEDLSQLVITRLTKDELSIELRSPHEPGKLPAKINLELNDKNITGSYQLSPKGIHAWLRPVTEINDIYGIDNLNGKLSIDFTDEDLLHAKITSATNNISFAKYNAETIVLNIKLEYSTAASTQNLKLLDGTYVTADKFNAGASSFTDNRIYMAGVLANIENSWSYKGTLNSDLVTASYDSQQLKLANIVADMTFDAQHLQAEGSFSPATLPGQFSFKLAHDLNSSAGSVLIRPTSAIDLNAEDHNLSKLITPWSYPLDLYTGSLKLNADVSWSKGTDTSLITDINFTDTGGNVGAIVFSGLSFDHKLAILPVIKSVKPSEIKLNTVDSGVTISNVSMSVAATTSKRGPQPRMVVRNTQGEILGGTFTSDDLVYDLNRDKNSFLIKLNNIDLAKVVETQQLEGITATGRLDGILPVEINKEGIVIAHGGLTNKIRGGTIRYNPESGTEQLKQNPITGITLDALRDFRYSDLQADVNYQPDGELTINLELKGISPELDEKRPVHLNINTEQNLVSLLKSLRFAQGVSDSIDDQVRRMYQQTNKDNQVNKLNNNLNN